MNFSIFFCLTVDLFEFNSLLLFVLKFFLIKSFEKYFKINRMNQRTGHLRFLFSSIQKLVIIRHG